MELEQDKETQVEQNGDEAQSPSRRKFLRTSSATALVTSLAAQPVWGQTCSGSAGSAASQAQDDTSCTIPDVTGTPADSWDQASSWTQPLYVEEPVTYIEPTPTVRRRGAPPGSSSAFTSGTSVTNLDPYRTSAPSVTQSGAADLSLYVNGFPSVSQSDAETLILHIKDVMNSNTFTIPATSTQPSQLINVADAMNSWGSTRNLAAIWLNAYFEFFDIAPPGRSNTPQDWVEHFHALHELSGGGDMVFNAVFNIAASTAWTLPLYVQETGTNDPLPIEPEPTSVRRRGAPPR